MFFKLIPKLKSCYLHKNKKKSWLSLFAMTERSTIVLIGQTTFLGFYIVLPLSCMRQMFIYVSRNSKTKIILIHVLEQLNVPK